MELLKAEYVIKDFSKPLDVEVLTPDGELPCIVKVSESPLGTPYALKFLCKTVSKYFEDKDNRGAFEEWYFDKYGEKYVWKTQKTFLKG